MTLTQGLGFLQDLYVCFFPTLYSLLNSIILFPWVEKSDQMRLRVLREEVVQPKSLGYPWHASRTPRPDRSCALVEQRWSSGEILCCWHLTCYAANVACSVPVTNGRHCHLLCRKCKKCISREWKLSLMSWKVLRFDLCHQTWAYLSPPGRNTRNTSVKCWAHASRGFVNHLWWKTLLTLKYWHALKQRAAKKQTVCSQGLISPLGR